MVAHQRLIEPRVTMEHLLAKQRSFSDLPAFLNLNGSEIWTRIPWDWRQKFIKNFYLETTIIQILNFLLRDSVSQSFDHKIFPDFFFNFETKSTKSKVKASEKISIPSYSMGVKKISLFHINQGRGVWMIVLLRFRKAGRV